MTRTHKCFIADDCWCWRWSCRLLTLWLGAKFERVFNRNAKFDFVQWVGGVSGLGLATDLPTDNMEAAAAQRHRRRYMSQTIRLHEIFSINRYESRHWQLIILELDECEPSICEGSLTQWISDQIRQRGVSPFKLDNVSSIQTSDTAGELRQPPSL